MYQMIVIDDEDEIRNGICNYFPWDQVGFQVAADFARASQALAYLSHHDADVILTDIRMPNINGIELIEAIRKKGFENPIVVLSGYAEFEYAKKVMAFGVRHYILKPARFQEIKKAFDMVRQELDEMQSLQARPAAPTALPEKASGIIDACKAYMETEYKTATLNSIAESVHMNPTYLSSLFHQQTGTKLYDYLLNVRMQKAAALLSSSDMSIQEISDAVGYIIANSFTRIFRQQFGISPTEYRLVHRG